MARHKGLHFYKKKKKINPSIIKEIWSWLFWLVIAVALAFTVIYTIGVKTSMIGESMEPSLYNGQQVLINRMAYKLATPKRGDVIVFLPNGNQNSHYYVKRIVALPGEEVLIKDGKLYIDGELEENADLYDKMADGGLAENEVLLTSEEYFVLGDNRNASEDSRSGNIGNVAVKHIIGKAWFHMASGSDSLGFVE